MLYEAERPALKVCGLPKPTARKYRYILYSALYSNSHIGGYIIVSVSCSDIDCGSWMRLTALNIGSMDRGSGLYKIGQN